MKKFNLIFIIALMVTLFSSCSSDRNQHYSALIEFEKVDQSIGYDATDINNYLKELEVTNDVNFLTVSNESKISKCDDVAKTKFNALANSIDEVVLNSIPHNNIACIKYILVRHGYGFNEKDKGTEYEVLQTKTFELVK